MKRLILILIIVLLALPLVATAQEPEIGTAADNACHPGGAMEGKCDTEWEWKCGYYLTRWEAAGGWGGEYPMNTDCFSLLPPPPRNTIIQTPSGPVLFLGTIACHTGATTIPGYNSFDFDGANASTYSDTVCGTFNDFYANSFMSTDGQFSNAEANGLCGSIYGLNLDLVDDIPVGIGSYVLYDCD